MTADEIRRRLEFYRDLGIGTLYRRGAAQASAPEASSPAVAVESPSTAPSAGVPSVAGAPLPGVAPPGDTLARISEDIGDCRRCRLCEARNKIVFGVGNGAARLVFVGEGPGADEDAQGIPFVGRAGQLLTQMIEGTAKKEGIPLSRQDVYICNVVKCRPPENRTPEKDEVSTCMPFLLRQIAAIQPKVIVCLGSVATQALLNTNKSISGFRGQWFDFRGSRLMATYHPAYLLRNPHAKHEVWADLKKVMAVLGLKPPRPKS